VAKRLTATGHIGTDRTRRSCRAAQGGYHWLSYRDSDTPTVARRSPDSWLWLFAQIGCRFGPLEIDHMNYCGPCVPPDSSQQTV
jgi:hypothetical protein